ncbi:hypothetical protein ANCCAN_24967 [Ancylostoma caninum]|uniref:Uncharacterized protein n=1 Tax=Ancylostoma caninum TaxID=29170 RepID=A0A368FGH1_ANCCA|nr:hypothetical protein ANCCAN_24967 [Ancylostoma caninum]
MRGAIVFIACFAVAHACSCLKRAPPSLEELFCQSHFGNYAKVTKKNVVGNLIYYDLEFIRSLSLLTDLIDCITTGPVLYYLDGIMSMYVSRCNLLRNWAEVSGEVEKFAKIECKNETETPITYE